MSNSGRTGLLLSASTVKSLIIAKEKPLKLIDVRPPEAYTKSHIPGAVNIHDIFGYFYVSGPDAKESIEALVSKFEGLFQEAGINGDDTVILYEDAGLMSLYGTCCRGYYLLKLLGHQNVSILHGGFEAWVKSGRLQTSTTAPVIHHKGTFKAEWTESLWSDKETISKAIKEKSAILLDVRDAIEWKGTVSSPVGVPEELLAPRKGRLPGAVNIEWYDFAKTNEDGITYFQEAEKVKRLCAAKGMTPESHVVVYCFVAMRSSLCYVALKEAGFKNVSNYFGSWNEWSRDLNMEIDSRELDH